MNASQNSAGVDERLTVMSYNIRYDTSDDGRDAWPHRRDRVVDMIEAHQPDLLGVQEALQHQFEYLEDELSNYAWYGVGRDDGRDTGEFVPLGFRADRFSLQDEGTLWLSERPHEPGSKSWDAYCPRIASWVVLESENQRESITHFNTHFDHRSALARHRSAELLRDRIAETAQPSRVVVTADLNSPESATPYTILAGEDGREREAILQDSRSASRVDKKGPTNTYHEFTGIPFERRDYIFVDHSLTPIAHRTIAERGTGQFSSDHYPLLATTSF